MPRINKKPGDRRYLWERGNRYWVQVAVPTALQERFRKKAIQRSLGTSDINEARRLRWSHVHSIKESFKRALANEDMTADEIEHIAQSEYRRIISMERLEVEGDVDTALSDIISVLIDKLQDIGTSVALDDDVITPQNPLLDEIEKKNGLKLSTEKRRDLEAALLRAQIEAYDAILKQRRGQEPDPVPMLNAASRSTRIVSNKLDAGILLGDARDGYLAAKKSTWTHKTQGQITTSLRLFCDHVGDDKPLAEINRLDVTNWREQMRRLHPRWASSPSSKGLPLDDLLATYGQGPETLSDKTLSRHLSAIYGLFTWAIDTGHINIANPVKVSGTKANPRFKRAVFSDAEVGKIFQNLTFDRNGRSTTHKSALPWLALLGAYTGARLEEVCGLKVTNIRKESGIWFLDIQNSKTSAGIRMVPLHSEVIAAGFLDYVKSHKGLWLFPSLGEPRKDGTRGTYIGKAFTQHCRDSGIEKPLLGFHMWRKTVATKLERAKVPEIEAARLLGHKINTMSYGVYSGGLSLSELAATVENIRYDNLKLTKI